MKTIRICVCGSKSYGDEKLITKTLDRIKNSYKEVKILVLETSGSKFNSILKKWIRENNVACETYKTSRKKPTSSLIFERNLNAIISKIDFLVCFSIDDELLLMKRMCYNRNIKVYDVFIT